MMSFRPQILTPEGVTVPEEEEHILPFLSEYLNEAGGSLNWAGGPGDRGQRSERRSTGRVRGMRRVVAPIGYIHISGVYTPLVVYSIYTTGVYTPLVVCIDTSVYTHTPVVYMYPACILQTAFPLSKRF